ncbi:MAG: CRISPR-associated endonuclease Cas3'', partial [Thermodesulfobacterium geofontis]
MERFYAKIYFKENNVVPETLEEHTENLLKELERLKNLYREEFTKLGVNDEFWGALKLSCLFHDLGKISSHFQRKIKKQLEQSVEIPAKLNKEIPHNYISGIFLYNEEVFKQLGEDESLFDMVLFSVLFHHIREIDFDETYLKRLFEKDIKPKIQSLIWLHEKYNIDISKIKDEAPSYVYEEIKSFVYNSSNKVTSLKRKKGFILLKGLLHRIDHSASAHLPVENKRIANAEKCLICYLSKKPDFMGLKDFQNQAKQLRDRNVLFTASTGIGKTEFAINWIGEDKAFYTLPVRVSVNAMYDRFVDIFSDEYIGLLHSDSLFYGLEKSESFDDFLSFEEHITRMQTTRQLSMPITITTADQLFTAVFKYPGYEKIYATLMYSKVV